MRPVRLPTSGARPAGDARRALSIERYLRMLESEPADGFAVDRLVELYRERDGGPDGLEARLAERLSDPAAFAPRMILGHLARRRGRFDEARTRDEEAAAIRPADPLPRLALARLARQSGDADGARSGLLEGLERMRSRAAREDVLRQLAVLALDRGDLEEARRRYDELAVGAGGSVYLRTEFARALLEHGEVDSAIAEDERAAHALRGDRRALARVLVEWARAQLTAGRHDEAIATIDRTLVAAGRATGLGAEAYELLLEAFRRSGRLEELGVRLERNGARHFEDAALLGRVYDELGRDEPALEAYHRALRMRPRDFQLRLRVTQVLARAGRLEELAAEYRALVRQAPDEPRWVVELATLLDQMGRRAEAVAMLEDVSRRSREPALHERLARLWADWGELARAEAELDRLTRFDPADPVHVIALGAQRFASGDREGAVATWRRILNMPGDRVVAYRTLGSVLADHDRVYEAV